MSENRPLRVAVVGAGPAGIYASSILLGQGLDVSVDLYERLPAPYGLVRYGVAPDHPRIKMITDKLYEILDEGSIRLLANVDVGVDISVEELKRYYDAIIFATGSIKDAPTSLAGAELDGCYGAASFVAWYDAHPDFPTQWPFEAQQVAVLGAGNVALDITRVLAKQADDLRSSDIPDHVYEQLKANPVTDIHVFARRGPAQAKFSPLELRELGHVKDVDVVVYPEDFQFDAGSEEAIESSNQTKQVVRTLTDWTLIDPDDQTASRRIHLHFLHNPVEVLGEDGSVIGLRTERMELTGNGSVRGTGELQDWPVGAVYRAIGYFGSPMPSVPFDAERGVIHNQEGRIVDESGQQIPGLYATGWIKRGPVGLIGHTKSDATETIRHLVADANHLPVAIEPDPDAVVEALREHGIEPIEWTGWQQLDAYERELGAAEGRERIKVGSREEMIERSRIAVTQS